MRRTLVALVVLAAIIAALSPAGPSHFSAVLTPLWQIFPDDSRSKADQPALPGHEQSVSYLSLAAPRAPPAFARLGRASAR
jgi:hypothetical protein